MFGFVFIVVPCQEKKGGGAGGAMEGVHVKNALQTLVAFSPVSE